MMKELTIAQINTVADRAVIESFTAQVVTVYKPTEPSAGQVNAGIHKQGVVVTDNNETLSLTLNSKEIHMDKSCEGTTFRFVCGEGNAGQPTGMTMNRWKKGDIEKINIDVWPQASFKAVTSASFPAEAGEPAKDEAAVKSESELPPPRQIESGHPPDPMLGVKNYFGFHRAIFDEVVEQYLGTAVTEDAHKESATHYMIGLQQQGRLKASVAAWVTRNFTSEPITVVDLKFKDETLTPAQEAEAEKVQEEAVEEEYSKSPEDREDTGQETEPPVATPWKEAKDSNGNVISQLGRDDLIDLCIRLIPFSQSENPVIQLGFEAAMRSRDAMELTFADIYDVFELQVAQEHDMDSIAAAYRQIESEPKRDGEVVCKSILMDQKLFIEIVSNHEKEKA